MALTAVAALGGCTLIPDYQRPDAPVAGTWSGAAGQQPGGVPVALPGWREFFRDPALQQLVGLALENNRDLRIASLNVESYRALYRVQRSELFPQVTGDGSASRSRTPADLSQTGEGRTGGQYSATIGASWEADLFGRLRSLSEQALQQYFASEAAQRGAQVSLVSSVATAYLTWQSDQALLDLSQNTLNTYRDSLRLTRRSFDAGVANALELRQAQTQVNTARASVARYSRLIAQDRNNLRLLLGQEVPAALLVKGDLDVPQLASLPVGLPSDLLARRPDIVEAEFQLKAANANIGAARAAFFPSISLTGAAGTASAQLHGLFDGGSGYWTFAPQISVPIFNGGNLRANLDYAKLQKDARVAGYEKAIQNAFKEVSDGLAARTTYVEQVQAQRDLVESSRGYYHLAERRYRTGVDNYLTLLDAQRQLFDAQQQLIGDRFNQLASEISLFQALGGGWQGGAAAQAGSAATTPGA